MSQNFRITTANDGSRRFNTRGGISKGGRRFNNEAHKNFNNRGSINPDTVRKLLDGDINMESGSSNSNSNNPNYNNNSYNNQRFQSNSRRFRGRGHVTGSGVSAFKRLGLPINIKNNNKNNSPNKSEWFIITILHARDLDKKFILESITNKSQVPFVPINFMKEENTAFFYVKTQEEAWAIRSLNKNITTPMGHKMIILIRKSDAPTTKITEEVIERIKIVMSRRYIAASATLNLSQFASDPEFTQNEILIGMNRAHVVQTILDIISKNIPELKALDLSMNNLNNMDLFLKLYEKAPHIEKLSLANNLLRQDRDIYNLNKLPITELILEGNALCDRYKEKQTYISFVRKCFPKVLKLDNQILPAPITFEVDPIALPESKGSYFENPTMQEQICIFLQQYFNCYDTDHRQNLLGAYHEKAVFSLSANYNKHFTGKQPNLGEYFQHCRKSKDAVDNVDKVLVGRENITSFLVRLPETHHDMKTLVVDSKFISPTMLLISVNGVFKEKKYASSSNPTLRTFSKVLITVPNGPGLAIINEMLNISCLPLDLTKKYFNNQSETSVSTDGSTSIVGPSDNNEILNAELMQTMVKQLSVITNMNETYSRMCLSENNWDYQKAIEKFSLLQQSNSIPAVAFIK